MLRGIKVHLHLLSANTMRRLAITQTAQDELLLAEHGAVHFGSVPSLRNVHLQWLKRTSHIAMFTDMHTP